MIGFLIVTVIILVDQKVKIIGFLKYIFVFLMIGFVLSQTLLFFGYDLKDLYENRLFAEGSTKKTTRYKAIGNFLIFFPKNMFFGTGGKSCTKQSNDPIIGVPFVHFWCFFGHKQH